MSYWLDNAAERGKHTLVDLGYVKAQIARDNADLILKKVSNKNLEIAANGRLLIRIPPAKVKAILSAFSQIRLSSERPGYCWCTHTWIDGNADDLKYASK